MKVLTIFKKNLKTVSRSWGYFVVLFIFPVLLIIVAGFMLNSVDFQYLKVGIVDNDFAYNFNLDSFKNNYPYSDLNDCTSALYSGRVSICIHKYIEQETHKIDIYFDNSIRSSESYVKRFVSEELSKEQSIAFDQTFEDVNSRFSIYSSSIASAKDNLLEIENDLAEDENLLLNYQHNLTILRSNFDLLYITSMDLRGQIINLKNNINYSQTNLNRNLNDFKARKQNTLSQIDNIKPFLSERLNYSDYLAVSSSLDTLKNNLNEMDNSLNNFDIDQINANTLNLFDQILSLIDKLQGVNNQLNQLDTDLNSFLQRIRSSRQKVSSFVETLNFAQSDMNSFSKDMGGKKVVSEFKKAFQVRDDYIFLNLPILITIIITFTSLVLSNMFIIKQINKPSFFKDIITPTSDLNFFIADYLVNLFFVFIQAIVLYLICHYWFSTLNSFYLGAEFFLVIFLASSIFIFLGMGFGFLIRSQTFSMLVTIFFLMFLLIISDLFSPLIISRPFAQFFLSINPFFILEDLLIGITILEKDLSILMPSLFFLGFLYLALFMCSYICRKIGKGKIIH